MGDAIQAAVAAQYRSRATIDLDVFGTLPNGVVMSIRFEAVPETDEDDYIAIGRNALIAAHCSDIDTEAV